jgi:hypothetical protein
MEMNSEENNTRSGAGATRRDHGRRDHGGFAPASSIAELVDWYARMRPWDTKFNNFNPVSFFGDAEVHVKTFAIEKLEAINGSVEYKEMKKGKLL